MGAVIAAAIYFGAVLSAGFALGVMRTLVLMPLVGPVLAVPSALQRGSGQGEGLEALTDGRPLLAGIPDALPNDAAAAHCFVQSGQMNTDLEIGEFIPRERMTAVALRCPESVKDSPLLRTGAFASVPRSFEQP